MDNNLLKVLANLDKGSLIVIDGFSGSGKTYLGTELSKSLSIYHIDTDNYVIRKSDTESYYSLLDSTKLKADINKYLLNDLSVILTGICIQLILTKLNIIPNFKVYLKKISSQGLWHDGLHIDEYIECREPNSFYNKQPFASDMKYHIEFLPHKNASYETKRIAD